MFKFAINKIKRKIYLDHLKKNNPKQYELEYRYSPERIKRKFDFKRFCKNNILAIIDLIIALAGLVIALISLIQ